MRPYYFTFTTHAKGRWCGEKLSEVFAREFRALEAEEYKRCIREGLVKVSSIYVYSYSYFICSTDTR